MQLVINGERRNLDLSAAHVAGVLEALAMPTSRVAVELNHTLVRKAEHAATPVKEGDSLEIVTLVGGG